jgi:uncharacterized protein YuzE
MHLRYKPKPSRQDEDARVWFFGTEAENSAIGVVKGSIFDSLKCMYIDISHACVIGIEFWRLSFVLLPGIIARAYRCIAYFNT